VVDRLNAALATPDDSDALQAAVVSSWPFAVGEAGLPTVKSGWAAAAARVLADLTARLAEPVAASDDAAALGRELAALQGPGFVAVPRFTAGTMPDLIASRDDPALVGGDPLAAEVWVTRMERVREPLARLGIAAREAEALGGPAFEPVVAQVPYHPGDTWNALPAPHYVDAATSLLLIGGPVLRAGATLAGLLVDEWAEVVPSASETTGVAFRYDPPESMAPRRFCWPCRRYSTSPGRWADSTRCWSRPSNWRTCGPCRPRRWGLPGSICRPRCWRSTPKATRPPPIPTG